MDLGELVEHLFDLADLEVMQARDLGHDLGDFLLAQRPQDRGAARSLPACMSRIAAFWVPVNFCATRYVLRSASQERKRLRDFVGLASR